MVDVETVLLKQKMVHDRKLDEMNTNCSLNDKSILDMKHQLEMFGREATRIDKEVQNTDFYLNKVEPISHVTQLTTMLREIIVDEE